MSDFLKRVGVGLAVFAFFGGYAYVINWMNETTWEPPRWVVLAILGAVGIGGAYVVGSMFLDMDSKEKSR